MSLTSPGVSQWTVNENSFGTQTMQTDNNWSVQHGDSFDSCKSYSIGKFYLHIFLTPSSFFMNEFSVRILNQ